MVEDFVPMPVKINSRYNQLDPTMATIGIDQIEYEQSKPTVIDVDQLPDVGAVGGGLGFGYGDAGFGSISAPSRITYHNGEKFAGGFGLTDLFVMDYWALRKRSGQLFRENLYARGLLRRLVTNVINTGLTLVSTPMAEVLGIEEDDAVEWAEMTETRWQLYENDPRQVDYLNANTFGKLQRIAKLEAMIEGDILVVYRFDKKMKRTKCQLIRGEYINTPPGHSQGNRDNGNRIEYGVETNKAGEHVAYWVYNEDDEYERIPVRGRRSGRIMARMVYGTDRRHGETRGEPLLSIILQSLKEIDRYRDASVRKAVLNSILTMMVTKDQDKLGTRPLSNSALRSDQLFAPAQTTSEESRALRLNGQIPGVVVEELQVGENIVAHGNDGIDEKFQEFEKAMLAAIAWANEMPPGILWLQFSSNYSASQGETNEFKIFLNKERKDFAEQFCIPYYHEWAYDELLAGKMDAPGLLDAMSDPSKYDIANAWLMSDWAGAIKPSSDPVKQVRAYVDAIKEGLITRERAARELFGVKFRTVVKRLKRENELLAEANEELTEREAGQVGRPPGGTNTPGGDALANLEYLLDDYATRLEDATYTSNAN